MGDGTVGVKVGAGVGVFVGVDDGTEVGGLNGFPATAQAEKKNTGINKAKIFFMGKSIFKKVGRHKQGERAISLGKILVRPMTSPMSFVATNWKRMKEFL